MRKLLYYYKDTRRDPDANTGGRWLEYKMFIHNPKGVGKRIVVDRQKKNNMLVDLNVQDELAHCVEVTMFIVTTGAGKLQVMAGRGR